MSFFHPLKISVASVVKVRQPFFWWKPFILAEWSDLKSSGESRAVEAEEREISRRSGGTGGGWRGFIQAANRQVLLSLSLSLCESVNHSCADSIGPNWHCTVKSLFRWGVTRVHNHLVTSPSPEQTGVEQDNPHYYIPQQLRVIIFLVLFQTFLISTTC